MLRPKQKEYIVINKTFLNPHLQQVTEDSVDVDIKSFNEKEMYKLILFMTDIQIKSPHSIMANSSRVCNTKMMSQLKFLKFLLI